MTRGEQVTGGRPTVPAGPVPPSDQWRRAPYLHGKNDPFWKKVEAYEPVGCELDNVLCIRPEVAVEDGDMVPPSSISRLRVERGDFPLSPVQYSSLSAPPTGWSEWVTDVIDDADFKKILERSHLMEPVKISQVLTLNRRNENLDFLISRWSVDTHTFVFPWGEFGPTLQDTSALLHLSLRGHQEFEPTKSGSADQEAVARLKLAYRAAGHRGSQWDRNGERRAMTDPKKTSWGSWLRYFFKDLQPAPSGGAERQAIDGPEYRGDLYLSAFIAFFLSFFLFPDFPIDAPSECVFYLAVRIARGDRFPLGPLFLGHLFQQLDHLSADLERSVGRYDITTMVQTQFLIALVYEHFPSAAPKAKKFPAQVSRPVLDSRGRPVKEADGRQQYTLDGPLWPIILRWNNAATTKLWEDVMDDESHFRPRPYTQTLDGVCNYIPDIPGEVDFSDASLPRRNLLVGAYCMSRPAYLPAIGVENWQTMVYRPDRVARQLGYDLVAPGAGPEPLEFSAAFNQFLVSFTGVLMDGVGRWRFPKSLGPPLASTQFRLLWRRNLDSFYTFVQGEAIPAPPRVVFKPDFYLHTPKAISADWRGARSRWALKDDTASAPSEARVVAPLSAVRVTRARARAQTSSVEEEAERPLTRRRLVHVCAILSFNSFTALFCIRYLILIPLFASSLGGDS